MKKYRKAAMLLSVIAAIVLQPISVLAGPSSDMGKMTREGNGRGPGSGYSYSADEIKLPLKPADGYGAAAVLGGLGSFVSSEEEAAGAIARGIDVSYWNQNIDWNLVTKDNVQFAMLAARFCGEADPFFASNADYASEAGIRLGVYLYSYADSVSMAEKEAEFLLNLIKDYPISFPVVFDAEDMATLGTRTPSEIADIINAFCSKIESAGYYPMVYANEYWLDNMIDMSKMKYDIWVARYQERFTYDSPAMWQASNTGSVNGVDGYVDINYLYKDFTKIIAPNLWRNIGGKWYYYKDHVLQRKIEFEENGNRFRAAEDGSCALILEETDV